MNRIEPPNNALRQNVPTWLVNLQWLSAFGELGC